MATFLDKLSQSVRGRKARLLVFGYINNKTVGINRDTNCPDDIINLCLKYYFQIHAWDPNSYSPRRTQLHCDENKITALSRNASAYLHEILLDLTDLIDLESDLKNISATLLY